MKIVMALKRHRMRAIVKINQKNRYGPHNTPKCHMRAIVKNKKNVMALLIHGVIL